MEKRAMAVREEQWIQTIAAANRAASPIKVWCAEHGVPVIQLLQVAAENERQPADCAEKAEIQFQELEVAAEYMWSCNFRSNPLTYPGYPGRASSWRKRQNRSAQSFEESGMLGDISRVDHIYLACGYTGPEAGIDGLAQIVQQQFELDPFSNSLFLFCGKRRDRIKALLWEGDGFVLLYKRMENGGGFQWPRSCAEMRSLSWQEFRWLTEGLSIDQPKANKSIERCVL